MADIAIILHKGPSAPLDSSGLEYAARSRVRAEHAQQSSRRKTADDEHVRRRRVRVERNLLRPPSSFRNAFIRP